MKKIILLVLCSHLSTSFAGFDDKDCEYHYFGLGGSKDLTTAFNCYQKRDDNFMLAILTFNGEGTKRDIKKAKDYFNAHIKGQASLASSEEELKKILYTPNAKPINFCEDLALDTLSMNMCGNINGILTDIQNKKKTDELKKTLKPEALTSFDNLLKVYEEFREAESTRAYTLNIEGTIRVSAAQGQKESITRSFFSVLDQVVQKNLPKATETDLAAADKALNQTYKNLMKEYANYFESYGDDAASKEEAKKKNTDLISDTKKAQRVWLKYRDSWLAFVKAAAPDVTPTSLNTRLIKARTEDLTPEER